MSAATQLREAEKLPLDEPEGPGQQRHIPELDGLRGIAVLMVVLCHTAQVMQDFAHGLFLHFMQFCLFGFLGVDVFFALSGFLITGVLLQKRGEPRYYRNFYVRRVLRLAPCYLIAVLIVLLEVPSSGTYVLLSLVYLVNFAPLFGVTAKWVFWSLAIEEHFYFLWPWLVKYLRDRALTLVCIATIVFELALRLYKAHFGRFDPFFSWYRFDGLTVGALVAIGWKEGWLNRRQRNLPWAVFAASAVFLLGCMGWFVIHRSSGFALLFFAASLLSAVLVWLAISARRPSLAFLRSPVLRLFGDISYWMYLTHFAMIFYMSTWHRTWLQRGNFQTWLVFMLIVLVPTVGTGVAVRRWIELPALRLKSRFA